jgi:hypothetical protein
LSRVLSVQVIYILHNHMRRVDMAKSSLFRGGIGGNLGTRV